MAWHGKIADLWACLNRCKLWHELRGQPQDVLLGDANAAAPLTILLDDAEPPPELLDRIEAELDGGATQGTATKTGSARLAPASILLVGFLLGAAVGGTAMYLAVERIPFHAIGLDGGSAEVLGHISLHGTPLHVGLQEFCRNTDFLMVSITSRKPHPPAGNGPHAEFTRKFLIHCNF